MSNVNYTGKDQNWANGETTYWFDVDGEMFGIVEAYGDTQFVDCDGFPIDDGADCATKSAISRISVTDEMRAE